MHVSDAIIAEIKSRERNGAVELPRRGLKLGDQVKVVQGPFTGHLGLYEGMRGPERILVLLRLLGSQQKVELASDAVKG